MHDYNNIQFHMDIPPAVSLIISILEKEGYEAYAVGGCVRDTILGRIPDDWDITTSALPEQVKSIFRRTIDTGIKHGTVTVRMKGRGYEVTTYRIDGVYTDSRHPQSVTFTSSLTEDLKRRDFTINAMAYNPKSGLADPFGGMHDIENKIIKCVGKAEERFGEDALRILRAVRFAAQLGFDIESGTERAMSELAPTLVNISKERIRTELEKLIMSENPGRIRDAYRLGITAVILPEFDVIMKTPQNVKYHIYDVGEHSIHVMEHVRADKYLRWAALLHDIGKPECRTTDGSGKDSFKGHAHVGADIAGHILRGLKLDNKTIDTVTRLIYCHMDKPVKHGRSMSAMRRSVNVIGKELYPMFLELREADINAKNGLYIEAEQEELDYMRGAYEEIIARSQCTSLKELDIKGRDLIDMGIEPGVEMGCILNKLLDEVIADPGLNKKEILMTRVKNHM